MDKDRDLAIKFLDKHLGLGAKGVHQLIRTDANVNALYQCSLEALAKSIETLRPFAQAAEEIEKKYGKDLPDHQLQFPEITMGQLRRTRDIIQGQTR